MARSRGAHFGVVSLAFTVAVISCGGETPPPAPPPRATALTAAQPPAPQSPAAPEPQAAVSAAPPGAEAAKAAATPPVATYTGFSLPESVLYDAEADRYLVSNINGKPLDKDNNGFISVLSPEGQVTTLKWIEGDKKGVKLDGPKGMALSKGVLYVADITVVRTFDAKSGAPRGDIQVPGATFLNNLASGPDGKIYLSDSGMKAGPSGNFGPSGTDAVYAIDKGHLKALAKGDQLGGPNGVVWTDKGILVCTLRSNEVYRLDDHGAKVDVTQTPAGHLDGLLQLGDSVLVTSHDGSAIYRGKLGGTFEVAFAGQTSPADIGYDTKRGRLLVPHLREDKVEAYDLK